jgi:hypothetical protein
MFGCKTLYSCGYYLQGFVLLVALSCGPAENEKPASGRRQSTTSDAPVSRAKFDSLLHKYHSLSESYNQLYEQHNGVHAAQVNADATSNEKAQLYMGEKKPAYGYRILLPDLSFYEGPRVKPGDVFWGVFKSHDDGDTEVFKLRKVQLKDSVDGVTTPFSIPESDLNAIFYFSGFDPGSSDVYGKTFKDGFIFPGQIVEVTLPQFRYIMYADGKYKRKIYEEGGPLFEGINDYELRLRTLKNNQLVADHALVSKYDIVYYDNIWLNDEIETFIMWAGDIDGDGRLDILAGDGVKTCSTITLYLSSKADSDSPVKAAAVLDNCGC